MHDRRWLTACAALALVAGAAFGSPAWAANSFPRIPVWAYPGAYQDVGHTTFPYTQFCQGLAECLVPLPDSVRQQSRTVTVRFLRDRVAEAREDFGGYRIYRVLNRPDSTAMILLRRYSVQPGDEVTWFMSKVNPATLKFMCSGAEMGDSIATFIDADSSGKFDKICPNLDPRTNRCLADSVFRLIIPPGPHDGFITYYAVTYEQFNSGLEGTYDEMLVPDTLDSFARCSNPANRLTCPNLNNKLANVTEGVEPTVGERPDLEKVLVVPNPYRAQEDWDAPGQHDIHFVNLPERATIKVYTVAGDLVRILDHNGRPAGSTTTSDFERWNLKNDSGQDVAAGIYVYRVTSDAFAFQGRFIVIR